MPVYEYRCLTHGAFEALRPMADFADPCPCPDCSAPAARVLLTAPRLAAWDRGRMKAHGVNERSSNEPKRSTGHGSGCACCGPALKQKKAAGKQEAAKDFPSRRPWMISH